MVHSGLDRQLVVFIGERLEWTRITPKEGNRAALYIDCVSYHDSCLVILAGYIFNFLSAMHVRHTI
jgi:hypothetical protein